jgi:predicted ATP-grasp superfamily ATP-dependent carboligase
MAEHPRLLLIVAQSARMLAQSATREGYSVRVADCFADIDTLEVADRFLKLSALDDLEANQWLQTIITLSDDEPCWLICGTGIERFYSALSQLPPHIKFAGPSYECFEQICLPEKWIAILESLSLPHPPTTFHKTQMANSKWLAKSVASWGGTHIVEANSVVERPEHYYQQYIEGISGSVLFLAAANDIQLLLFNQQFPVNPSLYNFSLNAISSGLQLELKQQNILHQALHKLTENLSLTGLMSLDFIIKPAGEIFLLELNPRPTASCQLLSNDAPIIYWQLMSSTGVMPEIAVELPAKKRIVWFCFAPEKIIIPADFDWPEYCHDLPAGGSVIDKHGIICSLMLDETEQNNGHHLANILVKNLSVTA